MSYGDFPPQFLPPGSPGDKVPPAPPGTIFVIGPEGGYAAPRCECEVSFGRQRTKVEVPVGVDDPTVSRLHGVFTCAGPKGDWYLRNTGNLPIKLPDGVLMLNGHERIITTGYTPLVITSSMQRSHLVEVRLVDKEDRRPRCTTEAETVYPDKVYELSPEERLVLTALAKRYLQGFDPFPLPLTWVDTAEVANAAPHPAENCRKEWTDKSAPKAVAEVRKRLHDLGVPGLIGEEVGDPVGSTLSVHLIRELIRTATLTAKDLELLGEHD